MQVIPGSFLLDLAMTQVVNGKVIPLWGSLQPQDQDRVQTLFKRLAGNGNQDAVIDELMQFTSAGFSNVTWANRARVGNVLA